MHEVGSGPIAHAWHGDDVNETRNVPVVNISGGVVNLKNPKAKGSVRDAGPSNQPNENWHEGVQRAAGGDAIYGE